MFKAAILASGQGTNALNILKNRSRWLNLSIDKVLTNKKTAGVISKAQPYCPVIFIRNELEIINNLKNVDILLLAGYMKLLSPRIVNKFSIFNIHPSLLPKYKGLRAYERAWQSKDEYHGVTIHRVDEGMDTGEILLQKKYLINRSSNSYDAYHVAGLKLEHSLYLEFLDLLDQGYINV